MWKKNTQLLPNFIYGKILENAKPSNQLRNRVIKKIYVGPLGTYLGRFSVIQNIIFTCVSWFQLG